MPDNTERLLARFNSKVDAWLAIVLVAAIAMQIWALVAVLRANPSTLVVGMTVVMIAAGILLITSVLIRTHYTVSDGVLRIVCGFFSWSIPVAEITRVSDSNNPISSPALSLDRVRIDYGSNKYVLVSPKDKDGFMRAIGQ